MKMANYTMQERSLILLMRVLMVTFFLGAILFAALPDYTLNYVTDIGRFLFGWRSPKIILGQERFWLISTVSLLFTMSYICAVVQKNPAQYIEYVRPLLIAKFVSTVGFIICLFKQGGHFFYLVGAIVDGLIFIVTLSIYKSAMRSRNRWTV